MRSKIPSGGNAASDGELLLSADRLRRRLKRTFDVEVSSWRRMEIKEAWPMIHQLRIYEIFAHNKSAFHARFRDHAARIMRKYGFDIVGMWEAESDRRTEFVYVLAWPDVAAKVAAWAKFMADDEWKEIKRVTGAAHGALVGEIEDRVLVATDYSSPVPRLAKA